MDDVAYTQQAAELFLDEMTVLGAVDDKDRDALLAPGQLDPDDQLYDHLAVDIRATMSDDGLPRQTRERLRRSAREIANQSNLTICQVLTRALDPTAQPRNTSQGRPAVYDEIAAPSGPSTVGVHDAADDFGLTWEDLSDADRTSTDRMPGAFATPTPPIVPAERSVHRAVEQHQRAHTAPAVPVAGTDMSDMDDMFGDLDGLDDFAGPSRAATSSPPLPSGPSQVMPPHPEVMSPEDAPVPSVLTNSTDPFGAGFSASSNGKRKKGRFSRR